MTHRGASNEYPYFRKETREIFSDISVIYSYLETWSNCIMQQKSEVDCINIVIYGCIFLSESTELIIFASPKFFPVCNWRQHGSCHCIMGEVLVSGNYLQRNKLLKGLLKLIICTVSLNTTVVKKVTCLG